MPTLDLRLLSDQFDHRHLHQLVHASYLIKIAEQIPYRGGLRNVAESDKGVALACRVGLCSEEGIKKLRSVGYEVFVVLID